MADIVVSRYAGTGVGSSVDGAISTATIYYPNALAEDSAGNMYVAESYGNKIRRISRDGVVSTYAGSLSGFADCAALSSKFSQPNGVAVDASGNVFVSDYLNNRLRKITPDGVVSTLAGSGAAGFADGAGTSAMLNNPTSICIDSSGNLYIADSMNNAIRRVTQSGIVTTIAGNGSAGWTDGVGRSAGFNFPSGLCIDSSGNLYVADMGNNVIRKVTQSGVVTTIAGNWVYGFADGDAANAMFRSPSRITVDWYGNLFVTDKYNYRLRMITPDGVVSTIAGNGTAGAMDGFGPYATFNTPIGVFLDSNGTLFVADAGNNLIRQIKGATSPPTSTITPSTTPTSSSTSTDTPIYDNAPAKASGLTTTTVLAISIPIVVVMISVVAFMVYMRSRNLRLTYIWYHSYPKLVVIERSTSTESPIKDVFIR